jgi:hypothetical protein
MDEKIPLNSDPFERKFSKESREHMRNARDEFWKSMEGFIPRGFMEHRRKAGREMLMAWRSMIDARLERMERENLEENKGID